jgi:predicted ATPase
MISLVRLRNFKCFQSLDLPLSPLTVLAGYNASGKSTSIQPLLLLAQTARHNARSSQLNLNGSLVRLGTVGEVVGANSGELNIGVESGDVRVDWTFDTARSAAGYALDVSAIRIDTDVEQTRLEASVWPPELDFGPLSEALSPVRNLIYLGASRSGTTEVKPIPDGDSVNADVGESGDYAAAWYAQNIDDDVPVDRHHLKEKGVTLRRQLDAYLSDLFPGAQADAEIIQRTALTRLTFRTSDQSAWLRPANIGYGLTYAFPLLVALLLARADQLIIIDSPEAHLHPQAQSSIGKMLARFAMSGMQIIVETHSDHVLNGVRLAVRSGLMEPEKLGLHFFSGATASSTGIQSPRVDSRGTLDYWPRGFFDQAELDLSVLSGIVQ